MQVDYGGGEMYFVAEPDHKELTRLLHAVVPTDAAAPCRHRLVIGHPAHSILQVAEVEGVDFIVMGTHGRTGLSRLLMGSVAEEVVRKAKCPVLTVKAPVPTVAEAMT